MRIHTIIPLVAFTTLAFLSTGCQPVPDGALSQPVRDDLAGEVQMLSTEIWRMPAAENREACAPAGGVINETGIIVPFNPSQDVWMNNTPSPNKITVVSERQP